MLISARSWVPALRVIEVLPPYAAGGTWLECGLGGCRRRRPPRLSLSFRVDRLFAGKMATTLLLNSLSPTAFVNTLPYRSFLGARLSLPPPPPPSFPVEPYLSHHPPYGRESSFVGVLASASRWPRPSCWLPTPVSVLVLPPPPYAMALIVRVR